MEYTALELERFYYLETMRIADQLLQLHLAYTRQEAVEMIVKAFAYPDEGMDYEYLKSGLTRFLLDNGQIVLYSRNIEPTLHAHYMRAAGYNVPQIKKGLRMGQEAAYEYIRRPMRQVYTMPPFPYIVWREKYVKALQKLATILPKHLKEEYYQWQ